MVGAEWAEWGLKNIVEGWWWFVYSLRTYDRGNHNVDDHEKMQPCPPRAAVQQQPHRDKECSLCIFEPLAKIL